MLLLSRRFRLHAAAMMSFFVSLFSSLLMPIISTLMIFSCHFFWLFLRRFWCHYLIILMLFAPDAIFDAIIISIIFFRHYFSPCAFADIFATPAFAAAVSFLLLFDILCRHFLFLYYYWCHYYIIFVISSPLLIIDAYHYFFFFFSVVSFAMPFATCLRYFDDYFFFLDADYVSLHTPLISPCRWCRCWLRFRFLFDAAFFFSTLLPRCHYYALLLMLFSCRFRLLMPLIFLFRRYDVIFFILFSCYAIFMPPLFRRRLRPSRSGIWCR